MELLCAFEDGEKVLTDLAGEAGIADQVMTHDSMLLISEEHIEVFSEFGTDICPHVITVAIQCRLCLFF